MFRCGGINEILTLSIMARSSFKGCDREQRCYIGCFKLVQRDVDVDVDVDETSVAETTG